MEMGIQASQGLPFFANHLLDAATIISLIERDQKNQAKHQDSHDGYGWSLKEDESCERCGLEHEVAALNQKLLRYGCLLEPIADALARVASRKYFQHFQEGCQANLRMDLPEHLAIADFTTMAVRCFQLVSLFKLRIKHHWLVLQEAF